MTRSVRFPASTIVPIGFGLIVWLAILVVASPVATAADAPDRPNILWITSEDNGPFFGCYGDKRAQTPNFDKLASEGILYRHAYANAPVCAPTRCTIITGVYGPSMGTQHMRSTYDIPDNIKLFPRYLREVGYFCSNNSKTDYNHSGYDSSDWDQISKGHYENRKPGQPFFSVFNLGTSHESSLHGSRVVPEYLEEDFELPPYHPDTPEIRSNWVQYYKIITRLDEQVGQILADLETAGLAEDTIVFYYSDHGGILTRSKRYLFDTGTRVPMIVRFPKKYQHLAPDKPGTQTDRIVSFVDLAPTVLSLAGAKIPDYMQGEPFLGPQQTEPRDYAYLFRGRMDEWYDMMRAVTDGRYRYIRNYNPHRIYGQHLAYLWQMPATRSWEKAYLEGKCNEIQSQFWLPKPPEELFDTQADPWEVNNLADSPAHREILERMRQANREHLLAIRDSGFLPEGMMLDRAEGSTIYEMVRDPKRYPLERLMAAAELAGERDPAHLPELIEMMDDEEGGVRYWAATGCLVLGEQSKPAAEALKKLLDDPCGDVRITAAETLCLLGHGEAAKVIVEALEADNASVVLHATNALEYIGEAAKNHLDAIEAAAQRKGSYVRRVADRLKAKFGG